MPESRNGRHCLDLSCGWEFVRGARRPRWFAETQAGAEVDLPHSFNETDTYQPDVVPYQGYGSYRRVFEVPDDLGPAVWRLEVGGFYGLADVWLDGKNLGRFDGQYLGLWLDLGALAPGRHTLGLRLDNRYRASVLPARRHPDFLLYGGLACGVRLFGVSPVHLRSRATRLRCELAERPQRGVPGLVHLAASMRNQSTAPAATRLRCCVLDAEGRVVAEARAPPAGGEPIRPGGEAKSELTLAVPEPLRWSPDRPYLYRALVELRGEAGELLDQTTLRFGLRHAAFRADGFRLDGEPLLLRGCNRHESLPGLGSALPEELERRDAELLKETGCNLVRLSHYPQQPAFLDACDELGLFVYAELASWKSVRGGRFRTAARRQWRAMIERDRHRPSVLVWGMGNESRSRPVYLELRALARELDPDRPVSYAENHLYRARRRGTVGIPDVWGVNYELEVLSEARAAARLGAVLVTECMNACLAQGELEASQLRVMEEEWRALLDQPGLAGYLVWCFADYATLYRRRCRRTAGLFDAWRTPRPGAFLFRARHAAAPFVKLLGDWALEGEPRRRVRMFSNCADVRVLLGEEVVARAAGPFTELELPFRPEPLRAEGWRAGEEGPRAEDRLEPWGEAEALEVVLETASPRPGQTIAMTLGVVDTAGRPVRSWHGTGVVRAAGPVRLRAFNERGEVELRGGQGRCYLTARHASAISGGEPGRELEVVAEAPGLARATAHGRVLENEVRSKAPSPRHQG